MKFSEPGSDLDYPAKLLLFGEYTVTLGSGALAVPYGGLAGRFEYIVGSGVSDGLRKLHNHLSKVAGLASEFDLDRFGDEISEGLVFRSQIPEGYGLGSSGAVVAAVYDRYAVQKTTDLPALKNTLAAMESVFHGSSSGLDPLVSYLRQAVLADDGGKLTTVDVELDKGLFLADTGISRSTGPLVDIFRHMLANDTTFREQVNRLKQANSEAIRAALQGEDLWQIFNDISRLQLAAFRPMIPHGFVEFWQAGLSSGDYALKLCGAGGGGMILGLSPDKDRIPSGQGIIPVYPGLR